MAPFGREARREASVSTLKGYLIANEALVSGIAPQPVVAGAFPGYLCRVEPDNAADSGWRVFTGSETQADVDDPSNFQINAVQTLLAVHPQLAQVLREGVSGAWEWNAIEGRYVEASD